MEYIHPSLTRSSTLRQVHLSRTGHRCPLVIKVLGASPLANISRARPTRILRSAKVITTQKTVNAKWQQPTRCQYLQRGLSRTRYVYSFCVSFRLPGGLRSDHDTFFQIRELVDYLARGFSNDDRQILELIKVEPPPEGEKPQAHL